MFFEQYPAVGSELALQAPRRAGDARTDSDSGGSGSGGAVPLRVCLLGGDGGETALNARWDGEGAATRLRVTLPPRECGARGRNDTQGRPAVESWFALRINGAE